MNEEREYEVVLEEVVVSVKVKVTASRHIAPDDYGTLNIESAELVDPLVDTIRGSTEYITSIDQDVYEQENEDASEYHKCGNLEREVEYAEAMEER